MQIVRNNFSFILNVRLTNEKFIMHIFLVQKIWKTLTLTACLVVLSMNAQADDVRVKCMSNALPAGARVEACSSLIEQIVEGHDDALLSRAEALGEMGDWVASRRDVEASLKLSPQKKSARMWLGRVERELKQFGESAAILSEILFDYPRDDFVRDALLLTLRNAGDTDLIVATFEQFEASEPLRIWAKSEHARFLISAGKPKEAMVLLKDEIEKEPHSPVLFDLLFVTCQGKEEICPTLQGDPSVISNYFDTLTCSAALETVLRSGTLPEFASNYGNKIDLHTTFSLYLVSVANFVSAPDTTTALLRMSFEKLLDCDLEQASDSALLQYADSLSRMNEVFSIKIRSNFVAMASYFIR